MAKSNIDLLAMKAELAVDPTALGYTGVDAEDVEIVNTLIANALERFDIPASEIVQSLNHSEYILLAGVDRQYLDLLLREGTIDARTGTEARDGLMAIFGAGSTTRTNLAALLTRDGTRAEEMWEAGTLESRANWTPSDIADARRAV